MRTDVNDNDRQVYENELKDFLPAKIFDAHTHIFAKDCMNPGYEFPPRNHYALFGGQFTKEHFLEWAAAWLPEQEMHFNGFGQPSYNSNLDRAASYLGEICDNQRFFGFSLVSPKDSLEAIKRRVNDNKLAGYKPYLRFVDWKPQSDITIEDMLPDEQMAYADSEGLAIMLHIPRPGRLADPVNQRGMLDICRKFPNAKIIFAHIGRAYYLQNALGMLEGIAQCPNAYVDTAMVNHEGVIEHAFRRFPRERLLFGSDAPIACLRGKSVEINNQYVYMVGGNVDIGTSIVDTNNVIQFTSFYYEQIRGIKLAAERVGLTRNEVENFFFNNAHRLFMDVVSRYHR